MHSLFSLLLFHTKEFISSGIPIVTPLWYYVIADQKDIIRAERKTAEYTVINSFGEKRAQNREKNTSGDYSICGLVYSVMILKFFH